MLGVESYFRQWNVLYTHQFEYPSLLQNTLVVGSVGVYSIQL